MKALNEYITGALNEYITESRLNVNGLWAICKPDKYGMDNVVGIAEGKDEIEACANYLFNEDLSACLYAIPLSNFLTKTKLACAFVPDCYDLRKLNKWKEIGEDYDRREEITQLAKKINKW